MLLSKHNCGSGQKKGHDLFVRSVFSSGQPSNIWCVNSLLTQNGVAFRIILKQTEVRLSNRQLQHAWGTAMCKRRVTAMLDEQDISDLETIAKSHRVSLAWVIRDAVSVYLMEKKAINSGEATLSARDGVR